MKKYFRTKDGRLFKVHEYESRRLRVNIAYWSKPMHLSIMRKDEILKEADTVEELCDECFITDDDKNNIYGTKIHCSNFHYARNGDEDDSENAQKPYEKYTFYGFIWVILPNGAPRLEPVAKMNKEGDWELL